MKADHELPDWKPSDYDFHARAQRSWGSRLAQHLRLTGNETVLDAGCGTGNGSTSLLLDALPRGHIIAGDNSPSMVSAARERFYNEPRVAVMQCDLRRVPLRLGSVHAVFSVAALHWIVDHTNLWKSLGAVLKPMGTIAVECGGRDNIRNVEMAWGGHLPARHYPDVDEVETLLTAANLEPVAVRLRPDPVRYQTRTELISAVHHLILRGVPVNRVAEVVDALPDLCIDWVRLEVVAFARA